ncbi:MAG: Uma2 family endonuclease [Myxococcota bacterium]
MESAGRKLTYEEYLALEEALGTKHEFLDGQVLDMAGGSPQHAALSARVTAALSRNLGAGPCVAFSSDLKLFVAARNRATFADAVVVCGPLVRAEHDRNAVTNPTLIVEVFSDATEAEDRGEKFAGYGTLPSFREYLLVDQHDPCVEVFRRNDDGTWTLQRHGPGDVVRLTSVPAQFPVDELYAGLELEPRVRKPRLVPHAGEG